MGCIKSYAPSTPFAQNSHTFKSIKASLPTKAPTAVLLLFSSQSSLLILIQRFNQETKIKPNTMQQTLPFKSQPLHSTKPPFPVSHTSNSIKEIPSCNICATWLPLKPAKSRLFNGSCEFLSFSLHFTYPFQDFHRRALVISARKSRRRTGSWATSGKAALGFALFIASNLKLLPDPIDLILNEYGFGGGGDGGGFGSGNGFGWGGFEGWGKRRRKGKFLKLGFLFLICGLMMVLFVSRKDFDGGFGDYLGFGILVMVLLGVLGSDWQSGGFKGGWVLGFCCCGFMVILGLKRDELRRWVQGVRSCFPVKRFLGKRRRKFLWLR